MKRKRSLAITLVVFILGISVFSVAAPSAPCLEPGVNDWNFKIIGGADFKEIGNPSISADPGKSVGWGYSIVNQNKNCYLQVGSMNVQPAFYSGKAANRFDFPRVAPLQNLTVYWSPQTSAGLYELAWDSEASHGDAYEGSFTLSADSGFGWYDENGRFVAPAGSKTTTFAARRVWPNSTGSSPGSNTAPNPFPPPTPAPVNNPFPTITQLSPGALYAGSPDVAATLTGYGFIPESMVRINSLSVASTFVNNSTLKTTIPAAALNGASPLSITISNPLPGGGTSTPLTVAVLIPLPVITAIRPVASAPGATFVGTLTGTNLLNATGIAFSGAGVTARILGTSNSTTSLSVLVSVAAGAELGSRAVTVTGPGGASAPVGGFTIQEVRTQTVQSAPQVIAEVEQAELKMAYAIVTPDSSTPVPSAFGLMGTVKGGSVLAQTDITAGAVTTSAVAVVDTVSQGGRNTGFAIVNASAESNTITASLFNEDGVAVGQAETLVLAPFQQINRFITEMFSQSPEALKGTISLQSNKPFVVASSRFSGSSFTVVSASNIGPEITVPGRASSNVGAIPVLDIGGINAFIFPQFILGGGWASQVVLNNTGMSGAMGRIDFFDSNGEPLALKLNGESKSTFRYSIPPGGTFVLAPRDVNGQSPM